MLALMMGEAFETVRSHGFGRTPRSSRVAVRKVCRGCERQRALFRFHGVVRWDRYHTLCFRCFRSQLDRLRRRAARVA
jgi:hypothetical protein